MKSMTGLFISIFALTVGDAVCSAWEVKRGWMTEANPLLHDAVMTYPVLSCALIAAAVGLTLLGIWSVRHKVKWLPYAMCGVVAVKTGIMGLHIAGIVASING